MIGDCKRFLTNFGGTVDKLFYSAAAVQKAVFGMHMKMCEIHTLPLLSAVFKLIINLNYFIKPVIKSRYRDVLVRHSAKLL